MNNIYYFAISFLLFTLLTINVKSQNQTNRIDSIEKKIQRIETGLVAFGPDLNNYQQANKKWTLQERMTFNNVPGVSVAIINNNQIEWSKGYGFLKSGKKSVVTTESIFEAASSTKTLTAAIILHYVEKGLLNLDVDVNTYLKTWKIPENSFTKDNKVTLRLILTHQSGLNSPNGGFGTKKKSRPTLAQVLNGQLPAINQPATIEFVPGTKWQYSNFGYIVLQLILEDIIGKPYSQIIQDVIFNPLGLTSSTVNIPLNKELKKIEAFPHDNKGKPKEPVMHPTALGHAGLYTTPTDLAKFIIELMQSYKGISNKILSKEMTEKMFNSEIELKPELFGVELSDGLGILLTGKDSSFTIAHPGFNFPGSNCWLIGLPEVGKGAIIMTNGANGDPLAMEIIVAIMNEYKWNVKEFQSLYRPKISLVLLNVYEKQGLEKTIKKYHEIVADSAKNYIIDENELNIVGYDLLNKSKFDDAIEIFKLIVELYPNSWNAYDSLGEGYMKKGNRELAILNYEKSMKLNPNNRTGIKALKQLKK